TFSPSSHGRRSFRILRHPRFDRSFSLSPRGHLAREITCQTTRGERGLVYSSLRGSARRGRRAPIFATAGFAPDLASVPSPSSRGSALAEASAALAGRTRLFATDTSTRLKVATIATDPTTNMST